MTEYNLEHEEIIDPIARTDYLINDFIDIDDAISTPPEWTLPSLLPTGLVILGAPAKSFKSTLTIGMALKLAQYDLEPTTHSLTKSFINSLCPVTFTQENPATTFIFSAEAHAGELKFITQNDMGLRLRGDHTILIAKEPWEWSLDNPKVRTRWFQNLESLNPKLVVVDPFVNFHQTDENDSGAITQMLGEFRNWAHKYHSTFLIVHHTRKLDERSPRKTYNPTDLRGSSALFGLADGVIMLTPSEHDQSVLMHGTFKRAPPTEKLISINLPGRTGK